MGNKASKAYDKPSARMVEALKNKTKEGVGGVEPTRLAASGNPQLSPQQRADIAARQAPKPPPSWAQKIPTTTTIIAPHDNVSDMSDPMLNEISKWHFITSNVDTKQKELQNAMNIDGMASTIRMKADKQDGKSIGSLHPDDLETVMAEIRGDGTKSMGHVIADAKSILSEYGVSPEAAEIIVKYVKAPIVAEIDQEISIVK